MNIMILYLIGCLVVLVLNAIMIYLEGKFTVDDILPLLIVMAISWFGAIISFIFLIISIAKAINMRYIKTNGVIWKRED